MSYPKFIDFGKGINSQVSDPTNASNPLTYCTFPTVNSQFVHGSTSAGMLYTPYSPNCQSFMLDYCSKDFNGYCEAYSVINVDRTWPNNAGVDFQAQQFANNFQGFYPTVGDNMIRNVVHRRFIHFPNKMSSYQQFDPNVANSPFISYSEPYVLESSILQNLSHPLAVETDPQVELMLNNSRSCFDVLARIYLGYVRKEKELQIKGTKLEEFLIKNSRLFNKFLEDAVHQVTSFKMGIVNYQPFCK